MGKKKTQEGEQGDQENLGYYAKNSLWPHVFTITQVLYDQLNQGVDSYRNRFLFDFETNTARRLEILGPLGEMRFDKKGEDWVKGADSQARMEASNVENFLNHIHALRIQHYTTDEAGRFAGYGLTQPWLTIKVTYGEQNKEETVVFGLRNKRFYAARQGEPSVYELGSSESGNLETKLKELSS